MKANNVAQNVSVARVSPGRTAGVTLGTLSFGALGLAWFAPAAWQAGSHLSHLSAPELLVGVLCGIGSLVLLWVVIAVLWSVRTVSRGVPQPGSSRAPGPAAGPPLVVRRVVATLLGVSAGTVIGSGAAWADNGLSGPPPSAVGLSVARPAGSSAPTPTSVLVPAHAASPSTDTSGDHDRATPVDPPGAQSANAVAAVPDPLPVPAGTTSTTVPVQAAAPPTRQSAPASPSSNTAAGPSSSTAAGPSSSAAPTTPSVAEPASQAETTGPPRPTGPTAALERVVRPGDTLWGIAAATLGPDADNAAVAAQWPRWYAANRALIGADPNLILPGQRLVAPPAGADR